MRTGNEGRREVEEEEGGRIEGRQRNNWERRKQVMRKGENCKRMVDKRGEGR